MAVKDDNDIAIGKDLDHVQLLFPNQYLAAADLRGRDVALTIEKVTLRDLQKKGGEKERKPVIHFVYPDQRRDRKKLVLNKTNATTVAKLYGPRPSQWAGKKIVLFPTQCEAFGKTTDCLRVRPTAPNGKPSAAPPEWPEEGAEPASDAAPGKLDDWKLAIENADSAELLAEHEAAIEADAALTEDQKGDLAGLIAKRRRALR